MNPEIWMSPDGMTTEVTTPTVAVRMRARGWVPAADTTPATEPKPAPLYDAGGALPPAEPAPETTAEAPAPADTPDEP